MKQKIKKYFPHIVIAIILLQTLLYKFTAHPESVALFSKIGLLRMDESIGRITIGILELLVSIGIFIRPLRKLALLGVIGLMSGAIYFHLTIIGFDGNNLPLFISGLVALVTALYLLFKKK